MFKKIITTSLVISTVFLNGCASTGIKIANIPSAFFDGKISKNIPFGAPDNQTLDIYTPKSAASFAANSAPNTTDGGALTAHAKLPVIVFFYGGRWTDGKKEDYRFVATALANQGFVVVVPDYRKYPKVRFPAFVEDGADAVKWVRNNIANYKGDADQLFLSGHSAGAHTAAMLAANPAYLHGDAEAYQSIKGFAGLAGPYDFTPEEKDLKDIFGPPAKYPEMKVPNFIEGNEAPMLLLWGKDDKAVGQFNLDRLRDKVQQENGAISTVIYKDIDHVEIVGAFAWFWRSKAPVVKDVTSFFKAILTASQNNL